MQGVRTPFPTRSARMPVDPPEGPVSGRSPLDWRPGPAHRPGYVMAYIPETGICWIPEKQASKMPVRARGTESRYGYVIAKEPSEVDEEWRNVRNGGSPGPNPLQLTGVPESVTAGPSNGAIEREEEEGPVPAVRDEAMLFRSQPAATGRSTAGNLPGPSAPLAASVPADSHPVSSALRVGLTTHVEQGQSTTARPAAQTRVPDNSLPAPSPATSWGGSYQPSRRSSLSLQLNNLPSPQDIPESGELQSIHDSVGVSVNFFPDRTSVSIRSERDQRPPGLLLDSREGSSRQVVTGLRDLEDVNRSLSSVERSSQRDAQSVRSAAPSRQSHSRQHSVSSYDTDVHVGPRTGLALYGSRPATHYSGGHLTAEPLPTQPLVSSSTRSQSRTSLRSRAESTHSSSHSVSSQRSSGQRPRRTSTTSSAPLRDPYERPPSSWGAELVGTQVYSSRGPYSNSRPQTSQDSIPRSLESIGGGFGGGGGGSLLLSFEAPSTSSAVDRHGEAAAGIHAPRPVSSRHSSMFNGAWNARNGR
ncbi:hypothetical protein C8Q78DRAFT_967519 [Trametes maxima]|nr:hypothetical protein C8Q78DRAFT_967519 [Trametes maxima]